MRVDDTFAPQRVRIVWDVLVLLFCGALVVSAVAALPYWFGQAFGYSAAYGRVEPEARAAEALFHCRARVTSFLVVGIFVFCVALRLFQLRLAHNYRWTRSAVRSIAEQLTIGIASWLLLAITGAPRGVEATLKSLADYACRR
jgi:hypothetical protein